MNERVVPLAGARRYAQGIALCRVSDAVSVEPHGEIDGALLVRRATGEPIGYLTARHAISREMHDGAVILHATVNSVGIADAAKVPVDVRCRIVTGAAGERYDLPPRRTWKVGIVGESHFQSTIRQCSVGDAAEIAWESGNPHDDHALAVVWQRRVIGYIGRDHWLRETIWDEDKLYTATIADLRQAENGQTGVVLDVAYDPGSKNLEGRPYGCDVWPPVRSQVQKPPLATSDLGQKLAASEPATTCPACANAVSAGAETCPYCRHDLTGIKRTLQWIAVAAILIVIIWARAM